MNSIYYFQSVEQAKFCLNIGWHQILRPNKLQYSKF